MAAALLKHCLPHCVQVHMAWRQAWHLIGRSQGTMRLFGLLVMLMAHASAAESFQGCPDSPQGLAVAEAAAAGVKDQGTPFVFQARVMVKLLLL